MPWLLRDGAVLASLEVAEGRAGRRRGLLGRDSFDGVLLLEGTKSVHTVGMRFRIDVAHLAGDGTVLRVTTMRRHRIGRPVRNATQVIEAEAGLFRRWNLQVGNVLEVRALRPPAPG